MKKIKNDIDVLSLKEKESLLKELKQEELLNLFKGSYKNNYKPIQKKKASLDQQISISIAAEEKDKIGTELLNIRKVGPAISISSYIRNKAISQVDIAEWHERAIVGLTELSSSHYNIKELEKEKLQYIKLLDDLEDEDDKETKYFYEKKIFEADSRLKEIKRIKPRRGFRLSGRVTFNEANIIRWRAARLTLTVADYMRFAIFDYLPYSDADKHLTVDARKRFYISIIDVHKNGWGNPPTINECPNCARYLNDIKILKEQIMRYKSVIK